MLTTNRLHLRELIAADIDPIHTLLSLSETDEFNTLGIPETVETTQSTLDEWVESQKQEPRTSYVFCGKE